MQSHLPLNKISSNSHCAEGTYALFSLVSKNKAIIFIHGYNDKPIKAWKSFDVLIPGTVDLSGYDIFFFGYDAIKSDLNASAGIFRDFMNLISNPSGAILPRHLYRSRDFTYNEFLLVSHSLGAVISRRAILDAIKENDSWAIVSRLLLFAPAHKGAPIIDLLKTTLEGLPRLRFIANAFRFYSPLIDQLKPGSETLNKLLDETVEITRKDKGSCLIAKKVVIAQHERIVNNDTFGDDPPAITILNADHKTVCKPNKKYIDPLTLLLDCL